MKREDIIDKYELFPFTMLIQSIERTFIDKIFAICDYHMARTYERHSRHLYDLHKIWLSGLLNMDTLVDILPEVIHDRQKYENKNPSCKKGACPKQILLDIIKQDVYKNDYVAVTNKLIYKPVSYEKCIGSISAFLGEGFIPEVII